MGILLGKEKQPTYLPYLSVARCANTTILLGLIDTFLSAQHVCGLQDISPQSVKNSPQYTFTGVCFPAIEIKWAL